MLLKDTVNLKEPLKTLCEKKLSNFNTARKLSILLSRVDEDVKFYISEYNKIINTYAKKDSNGKYVLTNNTNQSIELKDEESKQRCEYEISQLMNTEITYDGNVICISESDFSSKNDFPTAQEMMTLAQVIQWMPSEIK